MFILKIKKRLWTLGREWIEFGIEMKEVILNIGEMCKAHGMSGFDLQTSDLGMFDVLGVHPPKRAL